MASNNNVAQAIPNLDSRGFIQPVGPFGPIASETRIQQPGSLVFTPLEGGPLLPALLGTAGSIAAPRAVEQLGGNQTEQNVAGLLGGLGGSVAAGGVSAIRGGIVPEEPSTPAGGGVFARKPYMDENGILRDASGRPIGRQYPWSESNPTGYGKPEADASGSPVVTPAIRRNPEFRDFSTRELQQRFTDADNAYWEFYWTHGGEEGFRDGNGTHVPEWQATANTLRQNADVIDREVRVRSQSQPSTTPAPATSPAASSPPTSEAAAGQPAPAGAGLNPNPTPEGAALANQMAEREGRPLPYPQAAAGAGSEPPPPPEPPTGGIPPQGASPQSPGVFDAEPGFSGAQAAIDAKERTTLQPGRALGQEGSLQRKVVGGLNPSVSMPREVHVANQARTSVRAQLYGEFSRSEGQAAKSVEDVWRQTPAVYTGDPSPAGGTLADYLERPGQYQASQALTAAKDALKTAQDTNIARVRGEYGVDIKPYQVADPEGIYVPHVLNTDNLDVAVQRTSAGLSGKPGAAKTRVYDTLSERLASDPVFARNPELDVGKLMDIHSQSLASAAANNTFKLGTGGMTKVEVLDELHPGLRDAKIAAQRDLSNLRGRLETATGRQAGAISNFRATAAQERAIQARIDPLQARIDALGPEYGPELSHLSGQVLELRRQLAQLGTPEAGGRVYTAGENVRGLQNQIDAAQTKVTDLVKHYQSAGIDAEKYTLSPDTYRYHSPETAKSINSVLKTRFDNQAIETGLQASSEALAAGLGADLSPLTLNGLLGAASHPEVLIKDGAGLARAALSPEGLTAGLKPEDISRFEFASGRTFGEAGAEFRKERQGLERIPVLGSKGLHGFNDALERVTERGRFQAWLNDSTILQKVSGLSQEAADAEAMSAISKLVPARNPAETGRSIQRARLERAPVISTSFIAGPVEFAKDYASGAAKILTGRPNQLQGRETLALLRGTTMAATLTGISVASALSSASALNQTPEQAVKSVLNPGSSKFLSIVLPNGGSIGLGGPFRSFIRAVAPGWDKDGNFRLFAGGDPVKFIDAKLNLQLSNALDIYRNRDFQGNTIASGTPWQRANDIAKYWAENSNLVAGAVLQPERTGQNNSASEVGTQVVSQLAGMNYREASKTDQRDAEVRAEGLKDEKGNPISDYASASPDQKKAINAKLDTAPGGVDTHTESDVQSMDNWLRQNKDNGGQPYAQYKSLVRSLNQDENSRKAWDASKDLLDNYFNHLGQLISPQALAASGWKAPAQQKGESPEDYKARAQADAESAGRLAARTADPKLDAWIVYWGGSDTLRSQAAGAELGKLMQQYGNKPPRPGFVVKPAKDAK